METNKDIPKIIYLAIDRLKLCFGGTDVEIIGEKMYRLKPSIDAKAGKLGIDIKINGIKTFLGCESMAEPICEPLGQYVAEEFVAMLMKDAYPEKFK